MVSNSPPFDEVFSNFCKWHNDNTNMEKEKSIIITSGNWDIGNIFIEQCKLFPSTIKVPEFMCTWINIKKVFNKIFQHSQLIINLKKIVFLIVICSDNGTISIRYKKYA